MRRAADIVTADPEVVLRYGANPKVYGIDPGGRAEGRRYFIPEYRYDDGLTGEPHHRVKFNLEGDRGKKATVYAEVATGSSEFRYLLVVAKDGSSVVSVVDRRPPPLTVEERQARVTTLVADAGWAFYTDNDIDARDQAKPLGNYWLKVTCVRCDAAPARCEAAGVTSTPAWKTAAAVVPGVKDLAALEKLVVPLAREKEGKGKKKGWFSFLS
jgi:hypothetical protein